jgi:hypothetical protein
VRSGEGDLPGASAPSLQPAAPAIHRRDLRISAAAIDAGELKLGRGGFTVTAKQGAVAGEVGELELCGGSADGRLNVDLAQATKQVTWSPISPTLPSTPASSRSHSPFR